jgi:hypothetical protein
MQIDFSINTRQMHHHGPDFKSNLIPDIQVTKDFSADKPLLGYVRIWWLWFYFHIGL